MKIQESLPVLVSITVIIVVALVQRQSKLIAAVTATMPLNIVLALWIVSSSSQGEKEALEMFTQSLLLGIIPTVSFILAVLLAARAGLKLAPMIALGYLTWGLVLVALIGLRRIVGW
jgi:hypothetical protein